MLQPMSQGLSTVGDSSHVDEIATKMVGECAFILTSRLYTSTRRAAHVQNMFSKKLLGLVLFRPITVMCKDILQGPLL